MTIKNLIWDFDGTLCNSYPAIGDCYVKAMKSLGCSIKREWVLDLLHESMSHCESVMAETYTLKLEDIKSQFSNNYKLLEEDTHPPFSGTGELCKYIYNIGGKNLMVTHRGRKSVQQILKYFDLLQYFSDIITNDDNFPRKPDPTAFITILERNNIDRSTALGIGDRELDIIAAQGAGIRTCLFSPETVDTSADFTFGDYISLQQHIAKENQ